MSQITIQCSNKAAYECLLPLLQHIAEAGEGGHSFPIIVDDLEEETHAVFHFDGDGAHQVGQIKWQMEQRDFPEVTEP